MLREGPIIKALKSWFATSMASYTCRNTLSFGHGHKLITVVVTKKWKRNWKYMIGVGDELWFVCDILLMVGDIINECGDKFLRDAQDL